MQDGRIQQIFDKMNGKRVLVVGDVMVDEYLWGSVKRISPEAPVMVVQVEGDSWTPGGAANVVNNVQALGGNASIVGVIGSDDVGAALIERLGAAGVDVSGMVVDSSRPTTRKTRIIAHSQQVVRVDRESRGKLPKSAAAQVVRQIADQISLADIVVFSDYDKGMAVSSITEKLMGIAVEIGKRVIVNPKPRNYPQFRSAYLVSLNEPEAQTATGISIDAERDVIRAGKRLVNGRNGGPSVLVITRGRNGMVVFTKDDEPSIVPGHPVEVYDVAGAGDTVVSVLALALAAGAEVKEAALIANCAGGAAVRKVGVATVGREEIISMMHGGD